MSEVTRVARQFVKGIPYLQKELGRRMSIAVGKPLTTPMTYYVIFSGRCNIECTFCTIHKQVDPILSGDTMMRVIQEAKDLSGSGFNISLSGGEPTIYKHLYEALGLAQKLGVNFGFTTNGVALNKANAQKILAYDPFNINVSLESVDKEVNEAVRLMRDGTRKTLEGIQNLLEEKERIRARVSIIVKPTILEQTYRTLPALVRHFGKRSKVQVHFQPYVGHKGQPFWVQDIPALRAVFDEILQLQKDGYNVIGNEELFQGFMDYIGNPPEEGNMRHLDLGGAKRNCDIGLRSMFIYPNGDVHFCDFLNQAIGNIYKNSLSEIYYGTTAGEQRADMVHCNIDCQQTCKRPVPLLVKARTFLKMG